MDTAATCPLLLQLAQTLKASSMKKQRPGLRGSRKPGRFECMDSSNAAALFQVFREKCAQLFKWDDAQLIVEVGVAGVGNESNSLLSPVSLP